MMKHLIPLTTIVLICFTSSTGAQPANPARVVEMRIHPAAPAEPALKYRLTPDPADRTPGNAAQAYLVAFDHPVDNLGRDVFWQLLRADANDFNLDAARDLVRGGGAEMAYLTLQLAARRESCRWELPDLEQGIDASLYSRLGGQVQWYGGLVYLRARVAVAEHRFDDAVKTLQTGFAMSDHLAHDAPLGQALDALFADNLMAAGVRQLVQQPGAPNLYWPLMNLPHRSDQLRRVMEVEGALPFRTFPGLRHAERLSADDSRHILTRLPRGTGPAAARDLGDAGAVLAMMRAYPAAKRMLIESGMSAEAVEALPANSVVLAYDVAAYRAARDRLDKWLGLPPWQAHAGALQTTRILRDDWDPYNPVLALLPQYPQAIAQFALADRRVAMLAVVEGLRAHAAAHGGTLPASLDALAPATPAPPDPLSGRPFAYQLNGDVATLHADAPDGIPDEPPLDWRISIAR